MKFLSIGTDRTKQTVQTQIKLLLEEQYDQGQHCFPFHLYLSDVLLHNLFMLGQLRQLFQVSQFFFRYSEIDAITGCTFFITFKGDGREGGKIFNVKTNDTD